MPSSAHEAERAPPHRAARAEGVGRQGRDVRDERCCLTPRPPVVPFGQNQPTSATATGIAPQTTAQGVKIEPMNRPRRRRSPRAAARSTGSAKSRAVSGSRVEHVRDQHLALVDAQAGDDRQRRRARPTAARAGDDRDAREVVGRRRRGRRPLERAGVPGIVAGDVARARALRIDVDDEEQRSSAPARTAPTVDEQVQVAPAHLRLDRCRRAAACPQPEDVHREEGEVEADEEQPEVPAARAARSASGR